MLIYNNIYLINRYIYYNNTHSHTHIHTNTYIKAHTHTHYIYIYIIYKHYYLIYNIIYD